MPKEVNLFTYCGSSQMKEKLWRDMFIAHIFGVDMPEDIEVRRLSDIIKRGISGKEFSPALASLLILYGGGYIDDDAFIRIMPDCENYSDEIAEVEKILVEQGNDEGEDRYNGRIIQNVLMCAAYSKKFDEMQQIDIQSALALYDSSYTIISEGFVHLKDKEFLGMLLENDIEFAAVITDGKNISLEKLTKLDIQNGLDNGDFNDLKEYVERLMKGEKPSELSIKDCVLLDIKDIAYLTAVYKKPYYKDFLKYVKSENIPFDDNFTRAYENYVHKCKMKFSAKVYPRKRKICTKFPNWFDYNVSDNTKIETMEEDLYSVVGKENEYDENKLTNLALSRFVRRREFIPDTILEITHGDKIYIYIIGDNKKIDRLDNDSFRKIPFDFDDIWTTISEWSRDKKIRKELVGGKPEIIVTPESEWEKINPRDREYAKRLLEEQVQLKEEQLSKNKFMQKLCELKSNAESEVKAKKAQAEEIKQKKADFKNSKNNRKDGVNNA
jgi:hypothetical protein